MFYGERTGGLTSRRSPAHLSFILPPSSFPNAPTRIRTWNALVEARCDVRFTIRAANGEPGTESREKVRTKATPCLFSSLLSLVHSLRRQPPAEGVGFEPTLPEGARISNAARPTVSGCLPYRSRLPSVAEVGVEPTKSPGSRPGRFACLRTRRRPSAVERR